MSVVYWLYPVVLTTMTLTVALLSWVYIFLLQNKISLWYVVLSRQNILWYHYMRVYLFWSLLLSFHPAKHVVHDACKQYKRNRSIKFLLKVLDLRYILFTHIVAILSSYTVRISQIWWWRFLFHSEFSTVHSTLPKAHTLE